MAGFILGALLTLYLLNGLIKIKPRKNKERKEKENNIRSNYSKETASLNDAVYEGYDKDSKKDAIDQKRKSQTESYDYVQKEM